MDFVFLQVSFSFFYFTRFLKGTLVLNYTDTKLEYGLFYVKMTFAWDMKDLRFFIVMLPPMFTLKLFSARHSSTYL
jgi:hypothetical protein